MILCSWWKEAENEKIVFHRIPSFGLDAQIMTPLRWPGKCARGVGDDFLGGPWGLILPVKNNEKPKFLCF